MATCPLGLSPNCSGVMRLHKGRGKQRGGCAACRRVQTLRRQTRKAATYRWGTAARTLLHRLFAVGPSKRNLVLSEIKRALDAHEKEIGVTRE